MLLICGIHHRYDDQQVNYCYLPEAPMSAAYCKKSVVGNLVALTHELSPLFNLAQLTRGFDHIIIKLRAHQPRIRSFEAAKLRAGQREQVWQYVCPQLMDDFSVQVTGLWQYLLHARCGLRA